MKTYVIFWMYYGIRGNEEGRIRISAESSEKAAEEFYQYNRPCDKHNIGYEILCIEEEL